MSEPNGNQPDSDRVEITPKGDGVFVHTPCHGAEVFFPLDQAVPGAELRVICPSHGEARLVELAADEAAESGLRAVWAEATPGPLSSVEPGEGPAAGEDR